MRRWLCVGTVVSLLTGPVWADDDAAAEKLAELRSEYQQAQAAWNDKLVAIMPKGGALPFDKLPPHPAKDYLPRAKSFAKDHAGEPVAIPALFFVVELAGQAGFDPFGSGNSDANWAIVRLTRDHAADPALGEHLAGLSRMNWHVEKKKLKALYEAVIANNKEEEAIAAAKFGLALSLVTSGPIPNGAEGPPPARAVELLRDIVKNHSDSDVARQAVGYLFETEHLQVGMVAPEIEGEDADGNLIKLSDFRGKVVILDYWGFW